MEGICSKVNFCQICSLQFDNKFVYDLHISLLHKTPNTTAQSIDDEKSIKQDNDFSTQPIKEEIDISIDENILQITKNTNLSNKSKVKSPISSINKGQKTNECLICDGKFSTKRSLKQHIKSHHKEKLQCVSFCKKKIQLVPIA